MMDQWKSMTIDDLFALHEQMVAVLRERLVAKKAALEGRLQKLNQQSKVLETVKLGLGKPLLAFGHCGWAWTLLPLLSNL